MHAYGAKNSDAKLKIRQYLLRANLPNFPAIRYIFGFRTSQCLVSYTTYTHIHVQHYCIATDLTYWSGLCLESVWVMYWKRVSAFDWYPVFRTASLQPILCINWWNQTFLESTGCRDIRTRNSCIRIKENWCHSCAFSSPLPIFCSNLYSPVNKTNWSTINYK